MFDPLTQAPSDPLADVLRLTEAKSVATAGLAAGGTWALRFEPAPATIKFAFVSKGSCWLRVDGQKKGVALEQGDVVLITHGRKGVVLASNLMARPADAYAVFGAAPGKFPRLGNGDECLLMGGYVLLHPSSGDLFTDVLPPVARVRAASSQAAALRWIVDQIQQEQSSKLPGSSIASAQLAQLLFIQVLRAHLASAETLSSGWLRAISDERISPALRLMHDDPKRAWRLGELAKASAMSRTSFAVHFKAVAGMAPLAYLAQWRMRLAQKILRDEDSSIFHVGESLGYTSESAFSNAFKRITGAAPRNYRITARRLDAAPGEGDGEPGPPRHVARSRLRASRNR